MENKAGAAINADLKSVTAAANNSLTNIPEDLRYSITDADGKDSYPICGTTWAVLYVKQPADKGQAGRGFPAAGVRTTANSIAKALQVRQVAQGPGRKGR